MILAKGKRLLLLLTLLLLVPSASFAQGFGTTVKIVIKQATILKLVAGKKKASLLERELTASNPSIKSSHISRRGSTVILEFVTKQGQHINISTDTHAFAPELITRSNPLDREDISNWLLTGWQPEVRDFRLKKVKNQPAVVLNYHLTASKTKRAVNTTAANKLTARKLGGAGGGPPPELDNPQKGKARTPPERAPQASSDLEKPPTKSIISSVPNRKKPETAVNYLNTSGIIQNFKRGGIIMYFILGCSIIGLYISLERFYTLRKSRILPNGFIKEISSALPQENLDRAQGKEKVKELLKICENKNIPVARSLRNGLLVHFREGITGSKAAIVSSNDREGAAMESGLSILGLLGNISPLLGLLGTVIGMISAFDMMAISGSGKPEVVAAGISMALITTAGGLIVGIPLVLFFNLIQAKINYLLLNIEEFCMEVIENLIHEEEEK
ncbi:MAG: MotA/TolQ/ExbB proton channel family protein [bacterium]